MRLSELLTSTAVDRSGRPLGRVRDVRAVRDGGPGFRVVGLVVGDGRLASAAHMAGFAEGRTQGPWLLRALTAAATRKAVFVPADRVVDWGPGELTISGDRADLLRLTEVVGR